MDLIQNFDFSNSCYCRGNKTWKASTLYDFAKVKEYPVIDIQLAGIDLTYEGLMNSTEMHYFLFQCKRVMDCSLEHPIILDNYGQIADGYHRVCKAILEGKETIKAIRLLEMPNPDVIDGKED